MCLLRGRLQNSPNHTIWPIIPKMPNCWSLTWLARKSHFIIRTKVLHSHMERNSTKTSGWSKLMLQTSQTRIHGWKPSKHEEQTTASSTRSDWHLYRAPCQTRAEYTFFSRAYGTLTKTDYLWVNLLGVSHKAGAFRPSLRSESHFTNNW